MRLPLMAELNLNLPAVTPDQSLQAAQVRLLGWHPARAKLNSQPSTALGDILEESSCSRKGHFIFSFNL